MGNCCAEKGLLKQIDGIVKVYYRLPRKIKTNTKQIRIVLDGNLGTLPDSKRDSIEADQIYEYANGVLTLLKDHKGIRTGQYIIKKCFKKILYQAAKENIENIIFIQPNANEDNKMKLYSYLINSLYDCIKKQLFKKKMNIYVPWADLHANQMEDIFQDEITKITLLISD